MPLAYQNACEFYGSLCSSVEVSSYPINSIDLYRLTNMHFSQSVNRYRIFFEIVAFLKNLKKSGINKKNEKKMIFLLKKTEKIKDRKKNN